MQQLFLLVILTMGEANGLSAAFVGTETRAECEARGKAIRPILDGAKVEVKEFGCLPSTQRFQRFQHGAPADAPRFFYRLTLTADSVSIARLDALDACKAASRPTAEKPPDARIYCASSSQSMLAAEDKH
ncbi:MAG: hypothetical protein AB7E81_04085 [Hyphomicrobiaceae bacterium]